MPTEPDDHSLERELTATTEKLRLAEEEVLTLRRNLDQSRKAMCGAESHTRDLGHELGQCQARAKLRESEDERRVMKFHENPLFRAPASMQCRAGVVEGPG